MKANQIIGYLFLLSLFGLFFWFIDVRLGSALTRQYRTRSFSDVTGQILTGTVIQWTGSKGAIHYHPSFSYRYQVDGQTYTGRRYRYDGHPDFYNEAEAEQIVAAHPVDSKIDVYYNPSNPAETVLSTGLDTQDLVFPFLFGGINLLFLSLLITGGRELIWARSGRPISGVVKIVADRTLTRARLPRHNAGPTSLLVVIFLSLIAGMIFQMAHINYPPELVGSLVLVSIAIAWAFVYFLLRQKAESGSQDLVIDEGAGMLELPVKYERREIVRLTYNDVTAVTVSQISKRGRSNGLKAVSLKLRDGNIQRLTILRPERAEVFATWLREELKMKYEAPTPEPTTKPV